MRTGDIHKAIRNPEGVDQHSFHDWEQLVEKYPYFAVGHVFLAKSSHDAGHLDYKTHLQKAALYTGNRQSLYQLIIGPSLRKKIEKLEEEVETPIIELEQVEEEIVELEVAEDSVELEVEHLPEVKEEISQDAIVIKAKEIDELEKEILYEAVYSSIEQEVQEDIEEQEEEERVEIKLEAAEDDLVGLSPYAKWLKQRARQMDYNQEEQKEIAGAEKVEKEDLISKFIKTDPKISRRSQELFSNENLGKMSLVENEDFVTETLAKVYARQGKIEKAIKAYKHLSLKYPEKSIYFANQLKKLENKT